MIRSTVGLSGILAQGRHGANPGERDEFQDFVIDLEILVEVKGDSLDSTLDYRVAADTARDVVAGSSFELLESLADAVAHAVYQFAPVAQVRAVVHKPAAADSIGLDDVWAQAIVGP